MTMANNKVTQLVNRVDTQEREIIRMAERLARTILNGLSVASEASDYQKVRALTPLLKQMGCLGDVAGYQISTHDGMTSLARAMGVGYEVTTKGRDKD